MSEHDFCRALLAEARKDANKERVTIPHMYSYNVGFGGYQVFGETNHRSELAWEGDACCAWYARAQAIIQLIDDATGAS